MEKVGIWLSQYVPADDIVFTNHLVQAPTPEESKIRYEVYKKRMESIGRKLKELEVCAAHKAVGQ